MTFPLTITLTPRGEREKGETPGGAQAGMEKVDGGGGRGGGRAPAGALAVRTVGPGGQDAQLHMKKPV